MNFRRALLFVFAAVSLCHCQSSSSDSTPGESRAFKRAYQKGRKDAERDVSQRIYAIEVYGMPPPPGKELPMHPSIQLRSVAGCVVDDQIIGHARGYNEVSQAAIQLYFGSLYPKGPNKKYN